MYDPQEEADRGGSVQPQDNDGGAAQSPDQSAGRQGTRGGDRVDRPAPGSPRDEADRFLGEFHGPAATRLQDHTAPAAWTIRGLVGGINLILGHFGNGGEIPEHWFHVLDIATNALRKALDDYRQRKGIK